ncbi:unnamed protein product [Blepharisma stoltei]|uniref:ABC transporter domain-containing protein n=1 Tax=Blepharisma stoltei TaxID=1481888 RepID=A0AAU9JIQ3_9CILI|nr:unnamed protein product [Blepharisma stoltei]
MSWQHYKALMYKDWILWRRRTLGSVCEVLFPVIVFLLLAVIRAGLGSEEVDAESYLSNIEYVRPSTSNAVTYPFPEGDSFKWCREYVEEGESWMIGLAPRNEINEYLETQLAAHPNLQNVEIRYFEDDDEIDDYVSDEDYEDGPKFCFAVVFEEAEDNYYEYHIRFNQSYSIPEGGEPLGDMIDIFQLHMFDATDELIREPKPEFQRDFMHTGFLQIQNYVDNYLLQQITGDENAYIAPAFVPMYYDDYVDDDFIENIQDILPFFFIISFLIPVCRNIAQIVMEKEYRIKEIMCIMGLSNKAYWLSWITYYFLVYLVISILATIIMGFQIFTYSNKFILFFTFLLLGISCISFSVLISVFFSRAKAALALGLMVFLGLFFVFFAVDDPYFGSTQKLLASFIPSVAFGLSTGILCELEKGQAGVQFDNINEDIYNYKYSIALIMMAVDSVIFFALALYFEQVWPSEWGTKRPWYFIFQKDTWVTRKEEENQDDDFPQDVEYNDTVEPVDSLLENQKTSGRAMLVRNLTKKFNGNTAVDELNLDIYEGQIFALLGHNGAGKTTTISMLTGLIPATSGDMKVRGLRLSKDLDKLRKLFGVCPQQNVLYGELTPTEHLYLFSVFKGMKDKALIEQKIEEKLQEVDLVPHKEKYSDFLSGGQKRKLCLAMALIADSPIVLLDEPTSGMDLTARRNMWEMLKKNKSSRIVILTTHYMQEADILADRIAILSNGKLRCCGSSLFLKGRYGVGYYLTLVKEVDVASPEHSQMITDFVTSFIPAAVKASDVHAEIAFRLPIGSATKFEEFFQALDSRKGELKIRSYGVSVTTLEEVFIRVARGDNELKEMGDQSYKSEKELGKDKDKEKEFKDEGDETMMGDEQQLIETERETKGLFGRHMKCLLRKRYLWTKRDWRIFVFELLVPALLVLVGLVFMLVAERFIDQDPYELAIDQYETPQNVLYPESTEVVEQIMQLMDEDEDIEIKDIEVDDIEQFDYEVFDDRDRDPYRMGAYYFYLMSSTDNQYEPVVFHNQSAFQSVPTYYQLMSNTILQTLNPDIEVVVYNAPFDWTKSVLENASVGDGVISCLIFGLAFAFVPAGIASYIVRERETSVKHQHMITGISLWAYWISNYLCDIVKYAAVYLVTLLFIWIFQVDIFTDESDDFACVALLLGLYGLAVILFTYSTSFLFDDYSSAQLTNIVFHFLTGSLFPILCFLLYLFDDTRDVSKTVVWILRLLPNFCVGNGFLYLGSASIRSDLNGDDKYEPFSLDNAFADCIMLMVDVLVYFIVLILAEAFESNPSLRKLISRVDKGTPGEYEKDEDVEAEKEAALNTDPKEVQVNVRQLRKVYKGTKGNRITAVEDVSFNVPKCQCFALLGVNGAGKTTTFKMLTGEIAPTDGEAYLSSFSVLNNLDRARENIGYCPQFDALSELLTCMEHIKFYAEVKGINKNKIDKLAKDLLRELDLVKYTDYQAGTLSGGNKRKLQVAIALIGNPTVVFLDEPSAGMDPETRKKLWSVLGDIKKRDSAVVLTTHSMEEAEALSDRLAIMVGGRLRCIGTSTYLRNKFGQGYELEVKLSIPKRENVQRKSEKLNSVIGEELLIKQNQVKACLEALDSADLYEEISERGSGSGLYQQILSDGWIPREALVSWTIVERRGDNVMQWLKSEFKDVAMLEHYMTLYKYKIGKQDDKTIGYLFSSVEKKKKELKISEYALSQTTLDQIFTTFAMMGEIEASGLKKRRTTVPPVSNEEKP